MNDFDSSPAPANAVRLVARRASAAVCGFGAVALAFFLGLSARGATVSFTMTNQITGLPDTNFIRVFPMNPHANADGSYVTAGLPVRIQPNASGVYVWTNMLAGTYLATNAFIVGNYSGVGLPGSSQGIIFNVDNSTNSYPFTRYLRGGYDVYNWYLGIQGLYGTNGISVTNNGDGSWTIDAGGFSPTISFASVTNALGFLPLTPVQVTNVVLTLASTNSGISAASATNIANGVYSNNAAGYLVSVPVGATNQFATTNALGLLQISNANLFAAINLTSNALNNLKQPASLNLTNWGAIGTNQFAGTNFAGVAAHGILNSNDWQSFSARQPASGNLTNWGNLPTNALPRFVDVTNIASQYAGTASNAIGNAAGLGTNTTLVNAISVSVTNLAAQNATNGNERVTNLTVSVETSGTNNVTKLIVGNDANFGGFNVTNVNYIYLNGNNPHGTIIAGQNAGNSIVDAPPASGILMGQNNTITDSTGTAPTSSGILFGQRNTVQNELQNSAIFAGESNTISGTFSNTKIDDVILGGKKNTAIGNFDTVAGVNAAANHDNVFIWSSGNFATSAVAASVVFYPSNGFSINTNNAGTNGLRVAGNVDSTVGFSINGVPISQTAGSVAAGTNVTVQTNGTSYTVNAASQTNNFTTIVYSNASAFLQTNALPGLTNGLVANLGGQATNLTASGLLQVGGGQTFLITTNILGITNGIAQGTYQLMAGTWSNLNNATWTLAASAGTYYVYSNGVAYYSSASLTGTYSVVGGAPAPAPSVFVGFLMQGNGGILGGYVTSTNLTAQIGAAVAAISNFVGNGAGLTNLGNGSINGTRQTNNLFYSVMIYNQSNQVFMNPNTGVVQYKEQLIDNLHGYVDFKAGQVWDGTPTPVIEWDWLNRRLFDKAGTLAAVFTNGFRIVSGDISGATNYPATAVVGITNLIDSRVAAQSLTAATVNTNLFIAGVSQEGINTNYIILVGPGDTVFGKRYDWNATINRWTNGVYSVSNAVSAGNYRALDGSGSIFYFRTNSPQGTWQASLGTAPAPVGDWGRVSDFGPGGNASAYLITNLITGPVMAALGVVTNFSTVILPASLTASKAGNVNQIISAPFQGTHSTIKVGGKLYAGSLANSGGVYCITNADGDMTGILSNSLPEAAAVTYVTNTGLLYFLGTNSIISVDPANLATQTTIVTGLNTGQGGICTDGTNLYVCSFNSGNSYKITTAGSILITGSFGSGGHGAQWDSANNQVIFTAIGGSFGEINPVSMAVTASKNIGGKPTDDFALLGGFAYVGSETDAKIRKVNLTGLAVTTNSADMSYGIFTDGTNIFNCSLSGYFVYYPGGDLASPYRYAVGRQPNEMWITDGGRYIVSDFNNANVYRVDLNTILNGQGVAVATNNLEVRGDFKSDTASVYDLNVNNDIHGKKYSFSRNGDGVMGGTLRVGVLGGGDVAVLQVGNDGVYTPDGGIEFYDDTTDTAASIHLGNSGNTLIIGDGSGFSITGVEIQKPVTAISFTGDGSGLTNLTLPALNYVASTNGTSVGQTLYGNGGKTNWLQLTSGGAVYTNAGSGNNAIIHGTGVQFGTSNNAVVSQFFNSATGAVVNAIGAGITNVLWLPTNAGPVLTLNGVGILTSNSSLTGANVTGTVANATTAVTATNASDGVGLTNMVTSFLFGTGNFNFATVPDFNSVNAIYSLSGQNTVSTTIHTYYPYRSFIIKEVSNSWYQSSSTNYFVTAVFTNDVLCCAVTNTSLGNSVSTTNIAFNITIPAGVKVYIKAGAITPSGATATIPSSVCDWNIFAK